MTATDPRPALAAMLAEKLAPAAAALAAAYAEDASAEPPPPDDRALAERHRAGRAQLAHLHKLLALLDWAGAHLPAPEPEEEPEEELWEPPPAVKSDYDGGEDEFHYGGEVYVGSHKTPEFKAWLADVERRAGPLPRDPDHPDRPLSSMIGERLFIGDLDSPEYREWRDRQNRRDIEDLERLLDGGAPRGGAGNAPRTGRTTCPNPAA